MVVCTSSATDTNKIKSGTALGGTNSSWMPHKGVLAPAEKSLYISTADGAGALIFGDLFEKRSNISYRPV